MSFAAPVAPGENRRPAVVATAGYLLYLIALLLIVDAILPLAALGKVSDALRQAYAGSTNPTPDAVASGYRIAIISVTVVSILAAIGIAILAAFDLKGSQVARIITWVVTGVGVLCFGCSAVGSLASRVDTSTSSAGGVSQSKVNDLVNNAQPSWLAPTSRVVAIVGLLAVILVIILLALPAAHPYFRKAAPGVVGGPDPAYPNLPYPPVPGAGTPPAQPGEVPPETAPPAQPGGTNPPESTPPEQPGESTPPAPPA